MIFIYKILNIEIIIKYENINVFCDYKNVI